MNTYMLAFLALLAAFFVPLTSARSDATLTHEVVHSAADSWGPDNSRSNPLQASMRVKQMLGRNVVSVVLTNTSDEFLCIDSRMFDTIYSHIIFKEKSGEHVRQLSYGEPVPPRPLLRFDYDASYLFILPIETRTIDINEKNFKVSSGEYGYDILFNYYRCRDIVDRKRIKAKKDITVFGLHSVGTISLPPEE